MASKTQILKKAMMRNRGQYRINTERYSLGSFDSRDQSPLLFHPHYPETHLGHESILGNRKPGIRKITSKQLFKQAHKINGETFLKGGRGSSIESYEKKSLQKGSLFKENHSITRKNPKRGDLDNSIVKKVVNINIMGQKQRQLTGLASHPLQNEQQADFSNLSRLDFIPEQCEETPKAKIHNDDSLWGIINCMNGFADK